jgi:hypothetical protein
MPAKKPAPDFAPVFTALREILVPFAGRMIVVRDGPGEYMLNSTKAHPTNGGAMMFAAVQTMKHYVSFHFMPIYMNAPLQQSISPALRKRMQGKACFNFTEPDATLFRELTALTERGASGFRKAGLA